MQLRQHIYLGALCLGKYTEKVWTDLPYYIRTYYGVRQTNLLPENASQNDAIFDRSVFTTLHAMLKFL